MPWYNAVTGEHVYSPSDSNINKDELVYRPSMYTKEELPTWAEVYEDFYLGKQYSYDPTNPSDNECYDLYWKIPRKKFLIATVCNQFNKMIFEDNLKDQILEEINSHIAGKISNIQFRASMFEPLYMNIIIPPIYTIPHPSGTMNIFAISNDYRIDINKIESMKITAIIDISMHGSTVTRFVNDNELNIIIEAMIKPFKDYFTGEIGWKDSEGNPIEGDPNCRNCTGAGYCTT